MDFPFPICPLRAAEIPPPSKPSAIHTRGGRGLRPPRRRDLTPLPPPCRTSTTDDGRICPICTNARKQHRRTGVPHGEPGRKPTDSSWAVQTAHHSPGGTRQGRQNPAAGPGTRRRHRKPTGPGTDSPPQPRQGHGQQERTLGTADSPASPPGQPHSPKKAGAETLLLIGAKTTPDRPFSSIFIWRLSTKTPQKEAKRLLKRSD